MKPLKLGIFSGLSDAKLSIAAKGVVTGLASGLVVVVYRLGVEYGYEFSIKIFKHLRSVPLLIIPWTAAAVSVGLLTAWLVKLEPMASGSGIPQVKGELLYGLRMKWHKILAVRFTGGLLSSFFGVSLGREGPSIQTAACCGEAVAKWLCKNKLEENYIITGGAAAGLSAAFNAPISGIIFALEEVHRSFSPIILVSATTASLTADIVSKLFFGLTPVLGFEKVSPLPEATYIWLVPLGLLAGLIGALVNKLLLLTQDMYSKIPQMLRPVIAILLALPFGLSLAEVLGGGRNLVGLAEMADSGLTFLFVLLIAKIAFTCTSFGSGIPGGIFMPIISVGALTGSAFGLIASRLGFPVEFTRNLVICAMAGVFSGAVKAPVTGILLTAEMTGSLAHLLPVSACSFIGLIVSDILKTAPIYEALLEKIMKSENGAQIKNEKAGGIVEVPVELGSATAGKKIGEVKWPEGVLIVSIRRGDSVIVPKADTLVLPGDYLVLMSSELSFATLHEEMRRLCHVDTARNVPAV